MAAMAAFTFISCEDVPEPYTLPTQPETPGNTDPNQKGSESNPYTVTEAIAAIKAGTAPTAQVYLTGIISDVAFYNDQYKSITYYISDDGKSKDMQVYSGKGLNGADFASKEDLKVGQKVTILGKIMKFTDKNGNDIMEVDKTSSIVKIEGEGGGEVKPDPAPETNAGITINDLTVTLANSGVTAGESLKIDDISALKPDDTLTEIKLSDGTVIAFDKNSGTTPPAYNAKFKELRIYANNKMTFTASKPIAKIIFTCTYDTNKKWNAVGNKTATVVFSGNTATYTNTFDGTGGGVQLRIAKMEIVYAK